MKNQRGGAAMTILFLAVSMALFVLAAYYATTNTSLLSSAEGKHYKHAMLFAVLGLASLVAANFAHRSEKE